ncbi:MAG: hypothetical protein QOH60_5337 [Mycobacterium sp.]|jgi:hypothetical protein|nr:hypothetical protein [Mycobacterium sp.]
MSTIRAPGPASAKGIRSKRNRLAVQTATLTVLFAGAAQGVPAAQAYDRSACSQGVSWNQVDQISLEGDFADYGDDPHLGGAPRGTAVVCWDGNAYYANATRVQVIGKMYSDNGGTGDDQICTWAVISFLGGGKVRATHETRRVCSRGGLQSLDDNVTVNLPIAKVKIELFALTEPDRPEEPPHTILARTAFVKFGH